MIWHALLFFSPFPMILILGLFAKVAADLKTAIFTFNPFIITDVSLLAQVFVLSTAGQ